MVDFKENYRYHDPINIYIYTMYIKFVDTYCHCIHCCESALILFLCCILLPCDSARPPRHGTAYWSPSVIRLAVGDAKFLSLRAVGHPNLGTIRS